MAFSEQQCKSLASHIKRRYVRTRAVDGKHLSYLDGWHVIAEANRIFGHDCWDRRTALPQRVWEQRSGGEVCVLYTTSVSITVRAGASTVTREGIGTGFGSGASANAAYEIAIKAAETDATKRALATFGNPFGLELYMRRSPGGGPRQKQRSRPDPARDGSVPSREARRVYNLVVGRSLPQTIVSAENLLRVFKGVVQEVQHIEDLYSLWKSNKGLLKQLRTEERQGAEHLEELIWLFKTKADSLRKTKSALPTPTSTPAPDRVPGQLAFPKERRIRDKDHLARVRREPCLVCGRQPSHAHHVRYAQPGAFGMKVSDEYTVPLCALHHDALHRVGNESAWWTAHGIDPLLTAALLWTTSQSERPPDGLTQSRLQATTEAPASAPPLVENK